MLQQSKKRLRFGGLIVAALACAATLGTVTASAAGGSVAGWVARATKVGVAPANQKVTIAIHLSLKNAGSLKELATRVSSPASPQYGHYLTPAEIGLLFAPAAADVAAAEALLVHAGMTDVTVGPHGAYVSATATVAQLRTTFGITQDLYKYAGLTLRANREEPTLPAALAGKVLYVEGLDDSGVFRHPFHRSVTQGPLRAPATAAAASVTPPPVAAGNPSPYCNKFFGPGESVATLSTAADVYGAAIPWLNCGYAPGNIRAAYGLDKTKYNGAGVTVAILDAYASPTLLADSNRYAVRHGLLPLIPGRNFAESIPIGIYDVSPDEVCGPYGWWTEQSLDMASVHGAAPGAHILYIGSRDCGTSLTIALENAVYNHVADIITNSWGDGGESIAPGEAASTDQALMAAAAEGMTVLFSSGDDGDLSALNGVATGAWPATSPWVTGVGGTSLLLHADGTKSEYGWGTYRAFLTDVKVNSAKSVTDSGVATTSAFGFTYDDYSFYAGSGGGISLIEPQPAYQAGVVPAALATTLNLASGYSEPLSTAQRVIPDVAMDADPYTGYLYGETFTIAGNPINDAGCTPISATEEYCEDAEGGTSLASPLMAGVIAVMNQKRNATGQPLVGFANPLFYSYGSGGNGVNLAASGLNQITAPTTPTAVLRGYAANLNEARVVTINSVPFNFTTAPYGLEVCPLTICEGIDDVYNFVSLSPAVYAPETPPGYNDVTGLGVPYVPKLIQEE